MKTNSTNNSNNSSKILSPTVPIVNQNIPEIPVHEIPTFNTGQKQPENYLTQLAPTLISNIPELKVDEIESFCTVLDECLTQNTQTSGVDYMDPNVQQLTIVSDHRKRALESGYELQNGQPTKNTVTI